MTESANVVKRPPRPIWLSSERRHVSDVPPVMTPAEHAAMSNGQKVQDMAQAEDLSATVVIERPKDGHVDPSSD